MTRWQKIVHKIEERLAEIQVTNGYHTDAGLRTILIDCEADPERAHEGETFESGLVFQDSPEEPAEEQGAIKPGQSLFASFVRTPTIFGFRKMANRADWFDDAEELRADIKKAVFTHPEDQQFYRKIGLKSIRIGSAAARVPGYGDEYLGVEVALEVTYIENLSDPDS